MGPYNNQTLLLFSVLTLIMFYLQAECTQHINISPAPSSPPNLQPVSSPVSQQTPEPISAAAPSPQSQVILPSAQEISSTIHPSTDMRILKESLRGNLLYQSTHHHHHHPSLPSLARNPHIKKICDSTDYPPLCLSLIAPFFNGKCDPISVLEMAIKSTSQHIKLAIATTSKLAHKMPAPLAANLHHCKDNYHDALDNLQNARDAIPTRDVGTINSMLSAAVADFSDCDDALAGKLVFRISDYDDHLTKMVSNCLAIASLVK